MLSESEKTRQKIEKLCDLIDQSVDLFLEERKLWKRKARLKRELKLTLDKILKGGKPCGTWT